MALPVLYTFRRCPYAIRGRVAMYLCGVNCEVREVVLRDKPAELLAVSPKGTVPVLQLPDGTVVDESLDVIKHAFSCDPGAAAPAVPVDREVREDALALIRDVDANFAKLLKFYKYHYQNPERSQAEYRADIEAQFLTRFEAMLSSNDGTLFPSSSQGLGIADIAIIPLVRQFAHVDKDWFFSSEYARTIAWLQRVCDAQWFDDVVMLKRPQWKAGDAPVQYLPVERE